MNGRSSQAPTDQAGRASRLASAFAEAGVGSTAALEDLLARLYHGDSEGLSHLHRVARLTRTIGEELGIGPEDATALEHAALLHDIGRFVLRNPPALAASRPDASTLCRRAAQVQIACAIAADVPFLVRASAILAASVECFDGTGFPDGRRGEDIPLTARVLHLADTLDTLHAICEALAAPADTASVEVLRQAGSRFDPEVVSAWLRTTVNVSTPLVPWWASTARWN